MAKYQLLGSEASYYTGKARAYLRFKGIDFMDVTADDRVFKEQIIPRTGVRFIPVLVSPEDTYIQDTTDIIDCLEARFPEAPVYPQTPKQRLTAILLELYGDEWLKIPAMYYRWWFKADNYDFIVMEFGKTSRPDADSAEQRKAGEKIAGYFGGSLSILGVTEKNRLQIEKWYESFLNHFSRHLEQHAFLLGSRPSLGDYGLVGPLYAHLYRDPYPGKLMREKAPLVAQWVERMNAPQPLSGEFLPDDDVPGSLNPILEMMFAEHFPVLQDTVARVDEWIREHPDRSELPRVLGKHEFSIGGVVASRGVFSYDQWMLQRVLDYYSALGGQAKEEVDRWLKTINGYDSLQIRINSRVERVNNLLLAAG